MSNDYALINGHPRGRGGGGFNSPWGLMWAWFTTGFVDICCQFSAQDGGLDCFCNFIAARIPEEKTSRICYAPSRNGWEREYQQKYRECCPFLLLDPTPSSFALSTTIHFRNEPMAKPLKSLLVPSFLQHNLHLVVSERCWHISVTRF